MFTRPSEKNGSERQGETDLAEALDLFHIISLAVYSNCNFQFISYKVLL